MFVSFANAAFWDLYRRLPDEIQKQADKQFALFQRDPQHPSLHLKAVGQVWCVRINRSYRALARRRENRFYWFWIGTHDEYERLLDPAR